MFSRIISAFVIIWFCAAKAFAGDPYVVTGVHVDASAKNALEAQTLAISEGQTRAANIMVNRMSLASERDQKGFGGVSPQDGAKMIRALEIGNEKRSGSRYLADITVAFNPNAISQYMRAKGITLIATQSRDRLVIPVLDGAGLWDGNEWMQAWQEAEFGNSLTPLSVITPRAGLAPLMGNRSGANMSMQKLQAIGRMFGVQQIVIAHATAGYDGYVVTLKDISLDTRMSRTFGPLKALGANQLANLSLQAVEEDWKASSVSSVNSKSVVIPVSILYRSQTEWQELQDIINGSAQIRSAQLTAISKRGALMTLTFGGDFERLRNELSFKGVKLTEDETLGMVLFRTGAF